MQLPESSSPFSPSSSWIAMWWGSIDRTILCSVLSLIGIGVWLILAASPAVTLRHHWGTFLLLKKHLVFLIPGLVLLVATSFVNKSTLGFLARKVWGLSWIGLWAVLVFGPEIKGAKRWLNFGGFSLQPSEFIKPALIILTADILSRLQTPWRFGVTGGLLAISILPLLFQPDIGSIFLISMVWFSQCFIGGLPWIWVIGGSVGACMGMGALYLCFPHAAQRFHSFFSADLTEDRFGGQYQIIHALKSFSSGGWWGKGPGAGTVLEKLPDSHADFIFAVAGEELGLVACVVILGIYALIIFRGLRSIFRESDMFYVLSIGGLILYLMFQVFLNVGSVLRLIPTKGVTLPFISYGGSSFISFCWAAGMLLSLTRRYRTLW